jgi:hypothetical protein
VGDGARDGLDSLKVGVATAVSALGSRLGGVLGQVAGHLLGLQRPFRIVGASAGPDASCVDLGSEAQAAFQVVVQG